MKKIFTFIGIVILEFISNLLLILGALMIGFSVIEGGILFGKEDLPILWFIVLGSSFKVIAEIIKKKL